MVEILRKKGKGIQTLKEPGGYSIDVVGEVITDSCREFSRRKFTGEIMPKIYFTQGIIGDFKMGQEASVKRKR